MQVLFRCLSSVAIAVASSAFANAGVLTVGGANPAFADIQSAVTAAIDGDVVLVRDGGYDAFTIDGKSISIVADTGATVSIDGPLLVRNISAAQTVLIAGLRFYDTFTTYSIKFENSPGHVRVESIFASTAGYPLGATYSPVIVEHCADVAFASCTLVGPSAVWGGLGYQSIALPALVSTSSTLTFYECALTGGRGRQGTWEGQGIPAPGTAGAEAISATDSSLFARGSVFIGGKGGDGLSLTSCSSGYNHPTSGGVGGAGLVLQGGAANATLIASTARGGTGGLGGSDTCGNQYPPSAAGVDVSAPPGSVSVQGAPVLRFDVPRPAREGQNLSLHFEGPAGSQVLLLIGNGGAGHTNASALAGVLLIQSPLRRLALGAIPPSGVLDVLLPLPPDLGVGIEANVVHTQAIFIDTLGRPRLASPGVVLMLDSAF